MSEQCNSEMRSECAKCISRIETQIDGLREGLARIERRLDQRESKTDWVKIGLTLTVLGMLAKMLAR